MNAPNFTLRLWREVSRHEDISACGRAISAIVAEEVGEVELVVRRWDEPRGELRAAFGESPQRVALPTPRKQELLLWAERGAARSWLSRDETGLSRTLVPEHIVGACAAAPLRCEGVVIGVVVIAGPRSRELAVLLAEPFEVALVNDARLHEISRLREAAESDRLTLMSKLDREEVGDRVVGGDAGLREVLARVGQVAPTDAPVLILGETGAGKEVVAREVHARSTRTKGPFLRVNCGAIPVDLVDSELFGHERGSFTGAIAQRKGWFERADGGTLFLDEVAELPPAAQVRLLRVLQDGTFQRVGAQDEQRVDVRIIAATHRDMASLVRDGQFRQDLWYRISVFPVVLPSLRERRGDIAPLAEHFASRAGVRLFGRGLTLSPADVALLVQYDWPGNVRELAAVIERAAILGGGDGLDVEAALGRPVGRATEDERPGIEAALRTSKGRIEGPFGAAVALGQNPHTLRSRLRRLGIEWAKFR